MPTKSQRTRKVTASGQPSPYLTRYQGVPTRAISRVPNRKTRLSQLIGGLGAVSSVTLHSPSKGIGPGWPGPEGPRTPPDTPKKSLKDSRIWRSCRPRTGGHPFQHGKEATNCLNTDSLHRHADRLADEPLDLGRRAGPHRARHLASALEDGHGGDRLDAVLLPRRAIDVGVDLDHQQLSGVAGRHLLHLRGHHAAGAAPGGPEIDEHGQAGLPQQGGQLAPPIDLQRLGRRRQDRAAGAATGLLPQPGVEHPVLPAAGRTAPDQTLRHTKALLPNGTTEGPQGEIPGTSLAVLSRVPP